MIKEFKDRFYIKENKIIPKSKDTRYIKYRKFFCFETM